MIIPRKTEVFFLIPFNETANKKCSQVYFVVFNVKFNNSKWKNDFFFFSSLYGLVQHAWLRLFVSKVSQFSSSIHFFQMTFDCTCVWNHVVISFPWNVSGCLPSPDDNPNCWSFSLSFFCLFFFSIVRLRGDFYEIDESAFWSWTILGVFFEFQFLVDKGPHWKEKNIYYSTRIKS